MKILAQLKAELLANPATKVEYDALADEFDTARKLIADHSRADLTQTDVAWCLHER